MKEIMSYGNIHKSTVYAVERKFDHFQNKWENIVSKDALKYPEITITSSSMTAPLPTTAKGCRANSRRALRRCGWRRSGLLALLTATLLTILYVASLNQGSMQSLTTNSRIWSRRWRRWWGSLPGTPWWRPAWASGPGSRLSSLLMAVLLDKLVHNMYLCNFFLFRQNRMIFSCVVPFKWMKKKIPELSLPPCTMLRINFSRRLLMKW